MEKSKELIYGLNDRPPLRETLFAALQHLLAIFVAIITPPLIISSALKFDLETRQEEKKLSSQQTTLRLLFALFQPTKSLLSQEIPCA